LRRPEKLPTDSQSPAKCGPERPASQPTDDDHFVSASPASDSPSKSSSQEDSLLLAAKKRKLSDGSQPMRNAEKAFDRNSDHCLDGCIDSLSKHAVAFGGFADVWEGCLGKQKVAIKLIRPFAPSGTRISTSKLPRASL
jgi:hypothetical protein